MTKEEIYEHLAQVYLGKKTPEKKLSKKKATFKTFGKIFLAFFAVGVVFYSLTAFLSKRQELLKNNIIFALNNSPIRIKYNLNAPYPQVENFSLTIPKTDIAKYKTLNFSIRGLEEGYPGTVKVVVKNKRNELSFTYVDGVQLRWEKFSIPLSEFENITDWMSVTEVSFVLEAWNATKKKGIIF